jgi:hypothetical protein
VHGGGGLGYSIETQSGGAQQLGKLTCGAFSSREEDKHVQV